jgi:hypothetical protein
MLAAKVTIKLDHLDTTLRTYHEPVRPRIGAVRHWLGGIR